MRKKLTEQEKKENKKLYYQKNKEVIKEKNELLSEEEKLIRQAKKKAYREENKEKERLQKKAYREANKEKEKERKKRWNEENKDKIREQRKIYREKTKEQRKEYKENNKEKTNLQFKKRKELDPLFKLKENTKSLIREGLKRNGYKKYSNTENILGCSYEDFKIHLESKFESWMNWENYGNPIDGLIEPNKTWDIDHIIPLSLTINENEVLKLNHYTNLQPLCSYQNRVIKRNIILEKNKRLYEIFLSER